MSKEKVLKAFKDEFGQKPKYIVQAPGRVNLIGEHTDYNDGYVLPMAIERYTWIALRPRSDGKVRLYSLNNKEWGEFELDNIVKGSGWLEYIKGVAFELQNKAHHLIGWEGIVYGNIPQGAGLSSSAALELVSARAFFEASGFSWNAKEMALLGQRVENDWLGLSSGIMDQLVVAAAKKGFACLIDCRSLDVQDYPINNASVVILDTDTRRGLVESQYNDRFDDCKKAAQKLGIEALRDISLKQFEKNSHKLDSLLKRRARHVISENERVLKATKALENSDYKEFGKLMIASHNSLKNDFEVSSPALDTMVECALKQSSCYGARMTGAGFGGCAVALVKPEQVENFSKAVSSCYYKQTNIEPNIYLSKAGEGTNTVLS